MTSPETLFPISVNLVGRRCLVVGGGRVGTRRAAALLDVGAEVVVVDPDPSDEIRVYERNGELIWHARAFETGDVSGCFLVFAATPSGSINQTVGQAAKREGALFCGVDAFSERDFEVPGVVRRGDLLVTVSTGGGSPAFARLVRERLEGCLGDEYATFLTFLRDLRPRVLAQFPESPERRHDVWRHLVTWDMMALVRDGHWDQVEARVTACLSS